jgi:hypothetical protein
LEGRKWDSFYISRIVASGLGKERRTDALDVPDLDVAQRKVMLHRLGEQRQDLPVDEAEENGDDQHAQRIPGLRRWSGRDGVFGGHGPASVHGE